MSKFWKTAFCVAILLLVLAGSSALADASLTFTPENPRVGDYVDITVVPGREGAHGVRYELSTPENVVYKPKDKIKATTDHYAVSFRPREEAVYTLTATIVYGNKDFETVTVTIPVSGTAPAQEGPDVIYSQKDYWWHRVKYKGKDTLEIGGCAIFALSHLLQRMGYTGDDLQPSALASKYSRFYGQGGTDNGSLIRQAGADYGFISEDEVITTEREAVYSLRHGDLFSFGVALSHIAMADGVSEDGTLIHVVDSAPGATFERKNRFKTKGHIYYQLEDGSFQEAETIDQLPGIRWFFETGDYGGMEYWLDLNYALHYHKHSGMRLIRKPWLQADTGSGLKTVSLDYIGTAVSRVNDGGEELVRVSTKDLSWSTDGADGPQIAVVTNKNGAKLLDGNGNQLSSGTTCNPGTLFPVLSVEDDLCYIYWKNAFCYVSRKNVDLLPVSQETLPTGIVSANGKTAGTVKVTAHYTPKASGKKVTEWAIGTPVAVIEAGKEWSLVEGKGFRGWIPNKNLTLDTAE